jgi:diguanylate cyclase (GGDEF)-like protein
MAILVIDDRREARRLIQSFLVEGGFQEVITASSAEEGFGILGLEPKAAAGNSPEIDLILLDIVLEGINGLDACRMIKGDPRLADIPVVMMTGYSDPSYINTAFEAGAIEFLLKPIQKMELIARVRSIMHFKQEVAKLKEREQYLTSITDALKDANARLARLSHVDGLTGIANRRYFDEMFRKLLASATRLSIPIALLMLDIDHFKSYNDLYGHLAGDDCLKTLATSLNDSIKRGSDFIARYGGEEFSIVLLGTDMEGAVTVAEEIQKHLAELNVTHEGSTCSDKVTLSIGVAACVPEPQVGPEQIIAWADKALYRAKKKGKDRIELCDTADMEKTSPDSPATGPGR